MHNGMNEGANILKGRNNNQVILDKTGGIMVNSDKSKILVNIESQTPLQSQTPATVTSNFVVINPTGSTTNITGAADIIPLYYPTESIKLFPTGTIIDTSSLLLPDIEETFIVLFEGGTVFTQTDTIGETDPLINPVATTQKRMVQSNENLSCRAPNGWPSVAKEWLQLSSADAVRFIQAAEPNSKIFQAFSYYVMKNEQGSGEGFAAYNNNYAGFDLTNSPGYAFNPEIHTGYFCARDGSGEIHAFASFKTAEISIKEKIRVMKVNLSTGTVGTNYNKFETSISTTVYRNKYRNIGNVSGKNPNDNNAQYTITLTMPLYAAAYLSDWNGWGITSLINAPDINGNVLYPKSKYPDGNALIKNVTLPNQIKIWNKTKLVFGL